MSDIKPIELDDILKECLTPSIKNSIIDKLSSSFVCRNNILINLAKEIQHRCVKITN